VPSEVILDVHTEHFLAVVWLAEYLRWRKPFLVLWWDVDSRPE
jgi:hypothetical protein